MRFCEYRVQRLARHGTVTSEYLKDEFAGLGVTHTVKIINGVDTAQCEAMDRSAARRELGIAEEETVFLSFGNSFHKERTVWLFKLFDMILEHAPEARLHLNIAPDELWGKYGGGERLRPGTMERIRHVGYLSGRALSLQLGACDAVIFMLSDSKPDVACFPTRVGTFLNGGRFIIMNRNGSEAMRTLLELGCVVTADSLPDLARCAVEVLADTSERERLEAAALRARSALSWEQLGAPLAEFYRETLAPAR